MKSRQQARAYDFMPLSFALPREYAMFVEEFKRSGGIWIMKPIGSAQGRGIFLFTRLSEISEWRTDPRRRPTDKNDDLVRRPREAKLKVRARRLVREQSDDTIKLRVCAGAEPEAYIVQRYVENPYVIGGKKFDVRLYVLVTSFSPLVAYLYRGGFARFSHTRYSAEPADIVSC